MHTTCCLGSAQRSKLISTTITTNHYLETETLSQALKLLASSSMATYQRIVEPLGSLIINSAHLEMGVAALNWWLWSVGVLVNFMLIPGYTPAGDSLQFTTFVIKWTLTIDFDKCLRGRGTCYGKYLAYP